MFIIPPNKKVIRLMWVIRTSCHFSWKRRWDELSSQKFARPLFFLFSPKILRIFEKLTDILILISYFVRSCIFILSLATIYHIWRKVSGYFILIWVDINLKLPELEMADFIYNAPISYFNSVKIILRLLNFLTKIQNKLHNGGSKMAAISILKTS